MTQDTLNDPRLMRTLIRKTFTCEPTEAFAELLQNAQRAGAKNISFSSTGKVFTYADDGCGLNGVKGFRAMLALGRTGWSEEIVRSQEPMGVGINALLSRSDIVEVCIRSGSLGIVIQDIEAWWNDPSYYENWGSLLREMPPVRGLTIEVQFSSDSFVCVACNGSAQGYEGIFDTVQMNGESLDLRYDHLMGDPGSRLATEYKGYPLYLFLGRSKVSAVRWQGQIIKQMPARLKSYTWYSEKLAPRFFYDATGTGKAPLTLQAPSRRQIVDDERLEEFATFLEEFIFQSEVWAHSPEWFRALFSVNPTRAKGLPYSLVRVAGSESVLPHDAFEGVKLFNDSEVQFFDPRDEDWGCIEDKRDLVDMDWSEVGNIFPDSCQLLLNPPPQKEILSLAWKTAGITPGTEHLTEQLHEVMRGRFVLPGQIALVYGDPEDEEIAWVDMPPELMKGVVIEKGSRVDDANFLAIAEDVEECRDWLLMDDILGVLTWMDPEDCCENSLYKILALLQENSLPVSLSDAWEKIVEAVRLRLPEGAVSAELVSIVQGSPVNRYARNQEFILTVQYTRQDGTTWTEEQEWS